MPSVIGDLVSTNNIARNGVLISFILIVSWIALRIALRRYYSKSVCDDGIPTVQTPWFITIFRFLSNTSAFLHGNRARYGSAYRVQLPGRTMVVISHVEGIKQVLRDPYKCFTAFLNTNMFEHVGKLAPGTLDPVLETKVFSVMVKTFSSRDTYQVALPFNQLFIRDLRRYSNGDKVPLIMFVGRSIYNASSLAFFGPQFPLDTFQDFSQVDYSMLRFLFIRWAVSRNVRNAQSTIKRKIGAFLEEAEAFGDDSYKGMEIVKLLRSSGLPASDQEGVILVVMMAMHAALMRTILWFMAHLLSDASTTNQLREEIDRVIESEFGSLDSLLSSHPQRINSDTFPILHAALKEVLRIYTVAIVSRIAHKDTCVVIDDRTSIPIHVGDYIVLEGFSLNMGGHEFEDPYSFRLDRFLPSKADDTTQSSREPLSSFGGGPHLCKGREYALHAIKIFIISSLRLFVLEGELASGASTQGRPPKAMYAFPTPSYVLEPTFVHVRKRGEIESK